MYPGWLFWILVWDYFQETKDDFCNQGFEGLASCYRIWLKDHWFMELVRCASFTALVWWMWKIEDDPSISKPRDALTGIRLLFLNRLSPSWSSGSIWHLGRWQHRAPKPPNDNGDWILAASPTWRMRSKGVCKTEFLNTTKLAQRVLFTFNFSSKIC